MGGADKLILKGMGLREFVRFTATTVVWVEETCPYGK